MTSIFAFSGIPSPDTPRESAEFCLQVLQMVPLEPKRMADMFVNALENYLEPDKFIPADDDEEETYNRLCNRTFGFVKICAIQKPATAARMSDVLARMRENIATGDGADRLYDALDTIADGGRDQTNTMLSLIRELKKV